MRSNIYTEQVESQRNRSLARRRRILRRKIIRYIPVSIFALLLGIFVLRGITGPMSDAASNRQKVITSVLVQHDDTLWSIAEQYYTSECGDMDSYIEEIKETNGLRSDTIYPGKYIGIPYYKPCQDVN